MSSNNGSSEVFKLVLLVIIILSLITQEISVSAQIVDFSISSGPKGIDLVDQNNITKSNPSGQCLDNTVRVDPLDHFKKYRGGYDVTNKHYWSSSIFVGKYGYALGFLWLVCGIVYGGISLVRLFWYKNRKSQELEKRSLTSHKQCHFLPIMIAIFFTLLVIVASGVALGGNIKFHSEAKRVVDIIIDTANGASESINMTTTAIKDIIDNLEASGENAETQGFLASTSRELDIKAADLSRQAKNKRQNIEKGLKIFFVLATSVITLNLVAAIALSVSGIRMLRVALRLLIVLCWFMTVLCWVVVGMYFFFDKFSCDTCTALENFQRNPYNNSLSSILPCDQLLSAKSVLFDVSAGIHNLVNEVNTNMALQQPSIPISICNPFSEPPAYSYQPDMCSPTTLKIGDIPKVLEVFTCSDTENATCGNGEFSISNSYNMTIMESYLSSIQSLLNAYPGMERLVECVSVKDAFSEILTKHCEPMKRFARMVWASMTFLSMIMVILVLLWTTIHHNERSRDFFTRGSVELKTVKVVKDGPSSLV